MTAPERLADERERLPVGEDVALNWLCRAATVGGIQLSAQYVDRLRAELLRAAPPPATSDAIQWLGSNLTECKAWLGDAFGYEQGKWYFDQGAIVEAHVGQHGGYRDWLVRVAWDIYVVPDALYRSITAAPPPQQTEPDATAFDVEVYTNGEWVPFFQDTFRSGEQAERALAITMRDPFCGTKPLRVSALYRRPPAMEKGQE